MNKKVFLFIVIFLSFSVTKTAWSIDQLEKERLARWHINYASYLIDVGKYMEALENYETAYEISSQARIKAEALLAKATLLSTFLDASEEALKVYKQIEQEYPQQAEIALYRQGLLLFDMGRKREASQVLNKYLHLYPQGRFRFQAEALLERLKFIPPSPPSLIKRPQVRVRLAKGVKRLSLLGQKICLASGGCKDKFIVFLSGSRIKIGNNFFSREALFSSTSPILVDLGKKKKKVRGEILLRLYKGKILVLNILDIEKYLLSVVPSESIASWPLETLKAQAVAARTYAYYQVLHRQNRAYDLVDDEGDQAYGGVDKENPRSSKAVKETIGEILIYKKRPILAMYTANSGGYTADPKAVFDLSKPYLRARRDPDSLKGKMAHWVRRFKLKEIERRMERIGFYFQGLYDIKPAQIGPSGRIVKVKFLYHKGVQILRTRTTLRRALRLPDILFKIQRKGSLFIFKGGGFGHGVGYSQWGGAFMGQKKNYIQILNFYYPGAEVKKLW